MPGGQLPEGLVTTNNETVGEEIGNVDRVDLEDVARLWRDYSTSRALLHNNTGERLANFFWRIWSNPAVSRFIPGSTVARLFMIISEGGNRVRTTPVPSLRSTSPASRDTTPTPSSPQQVTEPAPGTDVADVPALTSSSSRATAESTSHAAGAPAASPRPSAEILRSVESVSDSVSASNRSPTSPSGALSPTSPTNPTDRSSSGGNRKRAGYFTATGARAKTKPSLPRRKSSQGASLTTADPKRSPRLPARKSPPRSPSSSQVQAEPAHVVASIIVPPPGLPSMPSTTSSFALPSTSWQDAASPASSQVGPSSTAATSQQPSSWLVDTNFRSRFVEKNRGASSTNLSGLGKSKSTVRFVDQPLGRRATSGAADARLAAPAPTATRDALTTEAQTRPRRDSGAIADEDDDDEGGEGGGGGEQEEDVVLPRTKSQLSMMIDQERRKSGTHELRPSPLQQEIRKGVGNDTASKPNDNENEEDDGLLMMGRKDGVTKAGTIGSRARGKQRSSPNQSGGFRYQSPPPPPLY